MSIYLFDRVEERSEIDSFTNSVAQGRSSILWLEGFPGTGKTSLLKYAIELNSEYVFELETGEQFYKCSNRNSTDFSYANELLITLERANPELFSHILFLYYNKVSNPSILESIVHTIPKLLGTPWIRDVFKQNTDFRNLSRTTMNTGLLSRHLVSSFAEVISAMTPKYTESERIVWCIDDVAWIDGLSLRTIVSSMRIMNRNGVATSIITTSRTRSCFPDPDQYSSVRDVLFDCGYKVFPVSVKNFTKNITRDYISTKGRHFLREHVDSIYEITNGNLQELTQAFHFSDQEMAARVNQVSKKTGMTTSGDYFSVEYIQQAAASSEVGMLMLTILAAIDLPISVSQLKHLTRKTYEKTAHAFGNDESIQVMFDALEKAQLITERQGVAMIQHDTISEIVTNIAIESGDYRRIIDFIVEGLLKDPVLMMAFEPPRNTVISLNMLRLTNPDKGSDIFLDYMHKEAKNNEPSPDIVRAGALCLSQCLAFKPNSYSFELVVATIEYLVSYSFFELSNSICATIYEYKNSVLTDVHKYYSSYVKTLIELDILDVDEKRTAMSMVEELIEFSKSKKDLYARGLLLKASVLEHMCRYDDIKTVMNNAYQVMQEIHEVESKNKIMFYFLRNQGLVCPHDRALDSYKESYELIGIVDEVGERERVLLRGTAANNVGLGYLFSGNLEKAMEYFKRSLADLEYSQYDTHRPLSNLGLCCNLMGDYQLAYEYLSLANDATYKGSFEALAMRINISVSLWFLGQKDEARSMIEPICALDSGRDKPVLKTSDSVVWARAMMTMAYFNYAEKNYIQAADLYNKSCVHIFRYFNKEEVYRRKSMAQHSLELAGLPTQNQGEALFDLDFKISTQCFIRQIFDQQPLAFYII